MLFVPAGSISMHMAGQSPVTLTPGQGIYSLPTTAVKAYLPNNYSLPYRPLTLHAAP